MSARRCLGSLLVAFLLPASLSAQAFEGMVRWGWEGESASMELTYYLKGTDKIRMEMGEQGTMVVNGDHRIMLMPSQRMWIDMREMQAMGARMGMPAGGDAEPDRSMPDLVETGETGEFAGVPCTYYRYTEDDAVTELCAAEGMGWFRGPGSESAGAGGRGGMGAPPGMSDEELARWRERFADGFFPLEIKQTRDGQQVMRMWAREIDRGPQSDDLFPTEGPSDYRKMSMGGGGAELY